MYWSVWWVITFQFIIKKKKKKKYFRPPTKFCQQTITICILPAFFTPISFSIHFFFKYFLSYFLLLLNNTVYHIQLYIYWSLLLLWINGFFAVLTSPHPSFKSPVRLTYNCVHIFLYIFIQSFKLFNTLNIHRKHIDRDICILNNNKNIIYFFQTLLLRL